MSIEALSQAVNGLAATNEALSAQVLAAQTSNADNAVAAANSAAVASSALGTLSVFPDTASGISAIASGKYFSVPALNGTDALILYLNNAGSPVEKGRHPSSTSVTANTTALAKINESNNLTAFASTGSYATIISSITNPLTRYSSAVDGNGYLNLTQLTTNLLLIGPLLPDNSPVNKLYEVEATFTGAVSGTGLALCINPSSATTMDLTNHLSITWRSNGTLLYYGADG